MDKAITKSYEMVSLEAVNVSSVLRALTKRFPGLVSSVKNFISNEDMWKHSLDLVDVNDIKKLMKDKTMTGMANVEVYIPPGLSETYTDYLKAIESSQDILDELLEETLIPFQKWLGGILSDPEELGSIRIDPKLQLKDVTFHDVEEQEKNIGEMFLLDDGVDTTKFASAFNRISDFENNADQLNDIIERHVKISQKRLRETLDGIMEYLEILIKRIEEDEEGDYKASTASMKTLADWTYAMALEVEFYSTHSYRLLVLCAAFKNNIKKLK